jgi:septal ring factor EnvC (AmiA/AmiB activator)
MVGTMSAARDIPTPSLDMNDGHAADWLIDLAEFYTGVDRRHVLALAFRLRAQADAAFDAAVQAEAKRRADALRRIADAEEEIRQAEREIEEAEEELSAAAAELAALKGAKP